MACGSNSAIASNDSAAPFGLPGRFTISALPLTPHTARLNAAKGVFFAPSLRMRSDMPGSRRSHTALVASGVLTLAQAAPLVRFRAQAMQQAVPVGVGAMAAVLGMESGKVVAGCAEATASFGAGSAEVVEAVNFNDPVQTVIAGSKAAVDKACELLKANGAKRALLLPVSAPFHSSLMRPAAEALREKLASTTLAEPQIPVLNNIDVAIETDADRIRDALVRQAAGPVRWVECVQALKLRGVAAIIECGPGKVLAGMVKRIAPDLEAASVYDPATLADTRQSLAG